MCREASTPSHKPHDPYLLIELTAGASAVDLRALIEPALASALEDGLLADATIAESEARADRLWFLREAVVEAQRRGGRRHQA